MQDKIIPKGSKRRGAVKKAVKKVVGTAKKSKPLKKLTHKSIRFMLTDGSFKDELMRDFGGRSPQSYQEWFYRNAPTINDLARQKVQSKRLKSQPLISVLLPTYNTNIEYLRQCIDSVLVQSYEKWELCIADDNSPNQDVRDVIKEYAKADKRIKYEFRKQNGHISEATNSALKLASGEFVALLDHDDVLMPDALYEIVQVINDNPKVGLIYSDEDKLFMNSTVHEHPFFKPDWNPDFLRSVNYITHFACIRKELVEKVGGFRKEYDGTQDWDMFLRITRETDKIVHIPKILYSWRIAENSTALDMDSKPYALMNQKKALEDDIKARGVYAEVITGAHEVYWEVKYATPKNNPLVSVVIPTKNQLKYLKICVNSVIKKTSYQNYEIVLVDTGSDDPNVWTWYKKLTNKHKNIRVVKWHYQPFSYSKSCNFGVKESKGEYVLLLNNDTEVLTDDWMERLLGDAAREEVGAVGCMLLYPDKIKVQHAGVLVGAGGAAANALSEISLNAMNQNQHLYSMAKRNATAVTAACLMVSKDKFNEVEGFDESFRVTYNDVDLCLKLKEKGYQNIYTPHVRVLHHESISVGMPDTDGRDNKEYQIAMDEFKKRWKKYIDDDPNYNKNFTRRSASLTYTELDER